MISRCESHQTFLLEVLLRQCVFCKEGCHFSQAVPTNLSHEIRARLPALLYLRDFLRTPLPIPGGLAIHFSMPPKPCVAASWWPGQSSARLTRHGGEGRRGGRRRRHKIVLKRCERANQLVEPQTRNSLSGTSWKSALSPHPDCLSGATSFGSGRCSQELPSICRRPAAHLARQHHPASSSSCSREFSLPGVVEHKEARPLLDRLTEATLRKRVPLLLLGTEITRLLAREPDNPKSPLSGDQQPSNLSYH